MKSLQISKASLVLFLLSMVLH